MPLRLQRKARRNKTKAAQRKASIKRLMFIPVIKCLDVEAIRQSFSDRKATV
ncbi:hypothetical protein CE557_271 [Cardinium endosymbiont of Sogatella furcifera]|uniref:hypothetical protein n=1 Tax=Cardinium endosymbiont of Sogatella furcifera TaxID=650378 RepID=UPI000E10362C|nr:hypothetical protein [Cardinium endosymbiont of Sogatella furcifera]AXI24105.1 hypothetical protein CE557_271 [Cardinium endosymbiont of Sogatella furcifera]